MSFINEVVGSTFSSVCLMPGRDVSGVSSDNANATRDRHTEMSYTVPDLTGMVSFFLVTLVRLFPDPPGRVQQPQQQQLGESLCVVPVFHTLNAFAIHYVDRAIVNTTRLSLLLLLLQMRLASSSR